ncbi:MAG: inositol monophosphatase [bacterium]|nr:inositol monophosphatase [bacterium]
MERDGRGSPEFQEEVGARLSVAKRAAVRAGKAALSLQPYLNSKASQKKEGLADIVTDGDFLSQDIIIRAIERNFPQDTIRSEELSDALGQEGAGSFTWFLDPIDGTLSYSTGVEDWGVSIGVHKEGQPVVGVVYFPAFEKTYWATQGGGAFCNRERIHTRQNLRLKGMPIYFNSGFGTLEDMEVDTFLNLRFRGKVQYPAEPMCATLAICRIAKGAGAHSDFHTYLSPFDLGAAVLILQEAGGVASQIDWSKPRQPMLVAADRRIYNEVLEILGQEFISKIGLRP